MKNQDLYVNGVEFLSNTKFTKNYVTDDKYNEIFNDSYYDLKYSWEMASSTGPDSDCVLVLCQMIEYIQDYDVSSTIFWYSTYIISENNHINMFNIDISCIDKQLSDVYDILCKDLTENRLGTSMSKKLDIIHDNLSKIIENDRLFYEFIKCKF